MPLPRQRLLHDRGDQLPQEEEGTVRDARGVQGEERRDESAPEDEEELHHGVYHEERGKAQGGLLLRPCGQDIPEEQVWEAWLQVLWLYRPSSRRGEPQE